MPFRRSLRRSLTGLALAALLAGACAGDGDSDSRSSAGVTTSTTKAPPGTTATTTSPPPAPSTTTAPATTAAPPPARSAAPAPAPAGAASCPAIPPRAAPRPDRPRYRLKVDVKPVGNVVEGEVAVRFVPDLPTDRLVFRLWANAPRTARAGARLDVGGVSVGGRAVDAVMETPTMLVARPGGTLAANQPLDIVVPWRLTLPGAAEDRISRSGDAIRLGSFFPILAWEPGFGWAVEPATGGFAEASAAITADFDATVSVPAGLDVLATGTSSGAGRWTASAVPDFALTVGRFTTATATVNAPQPVQVTVGVHAGIGESPAAYLSRVTRSLEDLGRRYGPYPWPSYSLTITPALSGGIEYPMHVFQGPGTMTRTTPHEVAHMWFYGLVGNNQGRDPWLDEGLASYAEARLENTLASFRSRAIPAAGRNRLGEPMTFWEPRQSVYYRSVYVQGAQALAALGDPDLVDCALRVYVARNSYRVARPADLVDAARSVFPNAADVLAGYGVRP
ncbi:MAG TPA: M1 family aminopeptidase [Acidimicrobiales bacterium]|nr:M1 family aminopeptidase [Acidimicrobiales bacterium]